MPAISDTSGPSVRLMFMAKLLAEWNTTFLPDPPDDSPGSSALLRQALLHEGLAFVAFFARSVGIACFHFFLLRRRGGSSRFAGQALFHEGLALVAFFLGCVLVARAHFVLLRIRGKRRIAQKRHGTRESSQNLFHRLLHLSRGCKPGTQSETTESILGNGLCRLLRRFRQAKRASQHVA